MKELLNTLPRDGGEWRLAMKLDPQRLPAHIAIIMDGNGRWARQRNYPRLMGHKAGVNPVRTVAETCAQLGLEALTLYAFSVENWKRPAHEIEGLWRLLRLYLRRELNELMRNDIRLVAIGRLDTLTPSVKQDLHMVMEKTAKNRGLQLNLALNYGGRTELVDAMNGMLRRAKMAGTLQSLEVNEESIAANLYTAGLRDPDLLIRTSGEMRISNFLLWQIAYAEIYVTDTLWPDFTRIELLEAIYEYQNRDRRYGGLTSNTEHGTSPIRKAGRGAQLIETPVRLAN
ncbi:MAG TPA: isoprenyl transferase [Bryobacteraceae bacterium]|nr:isoprenyl transferase [Bryobacteraceae bacterium]